GQRISGLTGRSGGTVTCHVMSQRRPRLCGAKRSAGCVTWPFMLHPSSFTPSSFTLHPSPLRPLPFHPSQPSSAASGRGSLCPLAFLTPIFYLIDFSGHSRF